MEGKHQIIKISAFILPLILLMVSCSTQVKTNQENQITLKTPATAQGNNYSYADSFVNSDDAQRRIDHITQVSSYIFTVVDEFYKSNLRMPVDLNEFRESPWFIMEPAPSAYTAGLKITSTVPADPELTPNEMVLTFSDIGYSLISYHPWGRSETGEVEFTEWQMGKHEFIPDAIRAGIHADNEANVRISLMERICDNLFDFYWIEHLQLPVTTEEMIDGRWVLLAEKLAQLPSINEGQPGYFLFGLDEDENTTSTTYRRTTSTTVITQKIYVNDEIFATGIIGRSICGGEAVDPAQITVLVDSSQPNWGFI